MGEIYGPRPFRLVVKDQWLVPLEGAYGEALEGITVVPLEQEVAAPLPRANSRTTACVRV
jgi:hypothetical protein